LIEVALHLDLVKALSSPQKLVQSLILAKLQQDVNVFCVFKEVLETDNVVLVQAAMDLDLRHKLLLGAGLGQGSLCNNFGR
jgi:hypothetical protein